MYKLCKRQKNTNYLLSKITSENYTFRNKKINHLKLNDTRFFINFLPDFLKL